MTFPECIAITGRATAGKSLFANEVAARIKRFRPVVFHPMAEALKTLALDLGWNGEKDDNGRRLLQILGTDVLRECIDEYWHVNRWIDRQDVIMSPFVEVRHLMTTIIDDVRFRNEIEMAREYFGGSVDVVLVERPSVKVMDHPSERFDWIDEFGATVVSNSGTKEMIPRLADDYVTNLIRRFGL